MRKLVLLVALPWLLACGDDEAPQCTTSLDCTIGECVEGRCVVDPPPDTGVADTGVPDGPPAVDGGPGFAGPVIRWPWNGAYTGGLHGADAEVTYPPLRPVFRWDAIAGAVRYQIQLTRECDLERYRTCAFDSPEVDESLPETVYRPSADLPVSTEIPVGSRYFARVRACDTSGCGEWSLVRYVDVGRSAQDYDGDGYADTLVGARRQSGVASSQGSVWLFRGGPDGPTEPATELPAPDPEMDGLFGIVLAALGDIDGDGFSDAVVGAHDVDGVDVDSGRAYVYQGGPDGLNPEPTVLDIPMPQAMAFYGRGVSGLGDVNADGYADFAVGAYNVAGATMGEGRAFIYYGSARGVTALPGTTLVATDPQTSEAFGVRVAAAGDVDSDGFADVLVSAYNWDLDMTTTNNGRALLFLGTQAGVSTAPHAILQSPSPEMGGQFGFSVAGLGDVNGDTFGEVIVSARGEGGRGRAYVYDGSSSGLMATPSWTTDVQADSSLEYGFIVAPAGDLDGDGLADAVVTARLDDTATPNEGRAWVFDGTTGGLSAMPSASLVGEPREQGAQFGFAASGVGDTNGDGYGDLFVGAVNQDMGQVNEGVGYWFFGGADPVANPADVVFDHPGDGTGAQFGGSVALTLP